MSWRVDRPTFGPCSDLAGARSDTNGCHTFAETRVNRPRHCSAAEPISLSEDCDVDTFLLFLQWAYCGGIRPEACSDADQVTACAASCAFCVWRFCVPYAAGGAARTVGRVCHT